MCGRMLCAVWQEAQFARDDQALLEQALAVDALGVVLEDVVLVDRRAARWTGVPSWWHLPQVNGHLAAARPASAGPSTGRMSCVPWQSRQRGASASPRVMALPWSDFACCFASASWQVPQSTCARSVVVGQLLALEVGVAVDALQAAVDRAHELVLIDEHRDRPAAALAREGGVAVAGQTILHGLRPGKRRRYQHQRQDPNVQPDLHPCDFYPYGVIREKPSRDATLAPRAMKTTAETYVGLRKISRMRRFLGETPFVQEVSLTPTGRFRMSP